MQTQVSVTIVLLALYILCVEDNSRAFVIVTAVAYLIALVTETCVCNHYIKNQNKGNKA